MIFLAKLPSFYQKQISWILFLIGKTEIFVSNLQKLVTIAYSSDFS